MLMMFVASGSLWKKTTVWSSYAFTQRISSTIVRSAGIGTGVGYFVAGSWMFLLGAVLVLGRGLDDAAALPAAVAAAGHEFIESIAHAEGDGAEIGAALAHAEAEMAVAVADAAGLADDLQAAGEKERLWIA